MKAADARQAAAARHRIRNGEWRKPTAALAPGFVQANLVVLPSSLADPFELFCRLNPRALPLLDRTQPGSPVPACVAPTADLRTDLPRYRVYEGGHLNREVSSLLDEWREDFVAFLTGCSFTFDAVLQDHGIPIRHIELKRNVPMYVTDRATRAAGAFSGPLVVSMRPVRRQVIQAVIELTSSLGIAHGAPVHVGDPKRLGIEDVQNPDYGDPVTICDDEVPCFWACGVTAQAAAKHGQIPFMITHAPGHMFITDLQIGGSRVS